MAYFKMGFLMGVVVVFIGVVNSYLESDVAMRCYYGERGSLTATCVNANASYLKLTQYRFDQLDETLRCVNCTLTILETSTFDISGNQIRNLNISNSKIEKVNQRAFIGLIFLETLDMSHNNIKGILPGTFNGVKKIRTIDLSYNHLDVLYDDGFLELINLEQLNMDQNRITRIDAKSFNGLGKLVALNLNHNSISDVKNVFSNLTCLQELNLMSNDLSNFEGREFFNLTSLLSLDLSFNKIKLPLMEVSNSTLKQLDLSHNEISELNNQFLTGMHKLESLDMKYNNIEWINKKVLFDLRKLLSLDLSYNKLDIFRTSTFTGLPQLEYLNCAHNLIRSIAINGVLSLHRVHTLDLSYNAIQEVDYVGLISRLPSLSYLQLEANNLSCNLEKEMNEYFAEDNFKFILYDPKSSDKKCVDVPVKHSLKLLDEVVPASDQHGLTGAEIAIVFLICLIFLCIGFLFFLQFRSYRNSNYSSPNRAMSSVHLVASEGNENEFLRE